MKSLLPVLLALSLTSALGYASVIPKDDDAEAASELELKAEVEATPALKTDAKPADKGKGEAESKGKGKWGYPPQWYPAGGDVPPYPYNPNYDQSYYDNCSWDPYFGYSPFCQDRRRQQQRQWMYYGPRRFSGRIYNDDRFNNFLPYGGYREDSMMNNGDYFYPMNMQPY